VAAVTSLAAAARSPASAVRHRRLLQRHRWLLLRHRWLLQRHWRLLLGQQRLLYVIGGCCNVTGGCCNKDDHMPNRKTPKFLESLLSDLVSLNKSVKDFLFNEDYRGARALDPWVGLRDKPLNSLWGSNPVHVKQEHFALLVEGVKISEAKISSNGYSKKDMGVWLEARRSAARPIAAGVLAAEKMKQRRRRLFTRRPALR
jgi:hypothetical protein